MNQIFVLNSHKIKTTLFQIVDIILGTSGYTIIFFHKFWHIIEKPIVALLLINFVTRKLPKHMNDSIICLISEDTTPKSFQLVLPLVLCNVLMKIVYKALANKLKSIMVKLTDKFQASFILGHPLHIT